MLVAAVGLIANLASAVGLWYVLRRLAGSMTSLAITKEALSAAMTEQRKLAAAVSKLLGETRARADREGAEDAASSARVVDIGTAAEYLNAQLRARPGRS